MKVCLAHGLVGGHSGSGRYILDLAERFAQEGDSVTLFCHECDADLSGTGIETILLPRPKYRFGSWRLGPIWHYLTLRRALLPALRDRDFDVLVGSDLLFLKTIKQFYGARLRFIYTPLSMIAPLEIQIYDLGGFRAWSGVRLYAWLQRWALGACDRVVRFAESGVKVLESRYRMDLSAKKLVAVYVSREFESVSGTGHAVRFERPEPRELLWVGRLIPIKNVDFLFRAVAMLDSQNWVLNVCSDGPDRNRLVEEATASGVSHKIRFLGPVADLSEVYGRASLFLTASLVEQYSLTLMEAYAFGVPIIGIKPNWDNIMNANEDQIVDGITGYLVSDEREMAARIDELLRNEPRRQQMARKAYEMKSAGFTFEAFFRQLHGAAAGL